MTDFLNEQAVQFLRTPRTKPFVLYIAHKAVHIPYLPAPRHDALYRDAKFDLPAIAAGDLEGKPVLRRKTPRMDVLRVEGATPEPAEWRRGRPHTPADIAKDQARCLASVDEGVGMMFKELERTGQLDNTLFIFTGDNGYLMGEHGLLDNKRWAYESSIAFRFWLGIPR